MSNEGVTFYQWHLNNAQRALEKVGPQARRGVSAAYHEENVMGCPHQCVAPFPTIQHSQTREH